VEKHERIRKSNETTRDTVLVEKQNRISTLNHIEIDDIMIPTISSNKNKGDYEPNESIDRFTPTGSLNRCNAFFNLFFQIDYFS
jgi:hypothetical protein